MDTGDSYGCPFVVGATGRIARGGAVLLSDFVMIKHQFPREIVIYPIADVHYGAVEHNEQGWRRLLDEILAQDNEYVILNGDLVNNSLRGSIGSGVYEDKTVPPRLQKEYMVEALRPLSERILCATSGNHERRTTRETSQDITLDIMARLSREELYRENAAFMSVQIGDRDNFTFCVTHGSGGGGIYTGASVNRGERFAQIVDVDCLVTGHTHKGAVTRPSRLVLSLRNGTVIQKEYLVVSCVPWLAYGGYALQQMLTPSTHSQPQKLVLRPATNQHTRNKKIEVIW